jgi:hypothetical protein
MGKLWSERAGQSRLLKRTSLLGKASNCAKILLTKLSLLQPPVRVAIGLTLLMLVLSLLGCATTSAPSGFTPRNPSPPQPSQSQPSQTYSSSAAADIQSWRKLLTDTLTTP